MLIPRELIEEIIARNNIEDVIGSYLALRRSGSRPVALCPFHSEKTPSFHVYSDHFYCFGCGAGGDVITFIMKMENLDYPGAVEFLAARAGISIPTDYDKDKRQEGIGKKRVFEMNLAAARFYRQCLFDKALGREGIKYFAEKRGLSGAVIKHFGLGYAPDGFDVLGRHLRGLGFKEEEMEAAYLRGKSQRTGRYYDLFRNRVMFPIIDTSGNVIAFGGRVLDDSKPKYLNSSDTPGFKKSKNLYALNFAKSNSAERMILCEGYMDVVACHAAGFENAVATLGTAITQEQARLMARYTKQVVIAYDSDEAGRKASAKASALLTEAGIDVRILDMKGAKDPDEYIKKFGVDGFRRILDNSRSEFGYALDAALAKYNINIPEEKIKALREMCSKISAAASGVEREVYIAEAAEKLGVSQESIRNDVNRKRSAMYKKYMQDQGKNAQMSIRNVGDKVNPDSIKNPRAAAAEEVILGLMLLLDERRTDVTERRVELTADDFFTDFGRRLFEQICSMHISEEGFMASMLGESFSPDEMGRIRRLEDVRQALNCNDKRVLEEAAEVLRSEKAGTEHKDLADLLERKRAMVKK